MPETGKNVVDPVCGMTVNREAAVVVVYAGKSYYFCENACAETFRAEPERWIEEAGGEPMTHSH